jgi:hypothetical protein
MEVVDSRRVAVGATVEVGGISEEKEDYEESCSDEGDGKWFSFAAPEGVFPVLMLEEDCSCLRY